MFGFNVSKAIVSAVGIGSGRHGNRGLAMADIDDVLVVLKGRGQLEDVLWLVGLKVVGQVRTEEENRRVCRRQ